MSTTSGDVQEDVFEEAGIDLPSHLNTKNRRWASLVAVAISGAFAAGPIASWPTLEPLLIEEGVWKGAHQQSNLTLVFSIGSAAFVMSALLAGILFDAIGPRAIGAGGAFGAAFCLVLMSLAIQYPSLNNLLWIAYPAANIFGFANQFDVFAFLWLLPDDQNTVAALAAAIQTLSDSFCLFAVFMHHEYGMPLPVYFMLVAVLSVIAGILALVLIPSQQEGRRIARAVISYRASGNRELQTAGENYGATDNRGDTTQVVPTGTQDNDEDDNVWTSLSKSWSAVRSACIVYTKVHPGISSLFAFYVVTEYMFVVYPAIEMYPLYLDLAGKATAVRLVNIFGGIYGCIGAISVLMLGKFMDMVDLVYTVGFLIIPIMANAYFYAVPTVTSQIIAQVLMSWMSQAAFVMIPRFVTVYGPPELFGSMAGILGGIMGGFQLILTPLGASFCALLFGHGKAHSGFVYLATIDMWCFLTVLASSLLLCWWWYNPLPNAASTTMVHVQEAEQQAISHSKERALEDRISCPRKPRAALQPETGMPEP